MQMYCSHTSHRGIRAAGLRVCGEPALPPYPFYPLYPLCLCLYIHLAPLSPEIHAPQPPLAL